MKNLKQCITLMVFLPTFVYSCQEISLRMGDPKDLPVLAALTRSIFYEDLKPIILEGYADNPIVQAGHLDAVLEDWISKRDEYAEKTCLGNLEINEKMVIAEGKNNNAKTIVGFCSFEKKQNSNKENMVYISFIGVDKQYRRQGIGTLLLLNAMQTFESATTCELTTLAHANEKVQEFYEKRGFVNQGLTTIDPRVTDTHYLYQKQLKQ